jgi:15,16-dihydrobiliverdin:ferredoxin oxidoreductase
VTTLKTILEQFFDLTQESLPSWLSSSISENNAELKSYLWKTDSCYKIRLCELCVQNKFHAESLVIYPQLNYETPIFGTEYLKIGKNKYFAAIDFHPITENQEFMEFLEQFPDKTKLHSKFYDLNRFFSKKLWMRRKNEEFYNEYQIMVKCFLHQYKKCLEKSEMKSNSFHLNHCDYNRHMSTNDPAYGILKSYFGNQFAEDYIHKFLFSNK